MEQKRVTNFMLAAHGELDEKFLWMSADEYER